MIRNVSVCSCLTVAFLLLGCSKTIPTVAVKGSVLLDKQPMKNGEITFVPVDGGVPHVFPIKDGAFSGQVKVGKMRIEIRAYKPGSPDTDTTGGGMYKEGTMPIPPENYIPDRYNTSTTLSEEVTKSKTEFTFEVTSE